jgi:hypothetical protein
MDRSKHQVVFGKTLACLNKKVSTFPVNRKLDFENGNN